MRVLVTGASGGLASFVIRALWERHEVVLMSRRPPYPVFATLPRIQGDITVFADCQRAVEGIDAMLHLAAQPWPVDHPRLREQATAQGVPFDATFQSNMPGTYDLMQAAVAAGVERVVMAGSNCALRHGYRISQTPFPVQALQIDESHPAYLEDSYSSAKLAGELLLASSSRAYGTRTSVTRPAAICSPARRQLLAQQAVPATDWNPWLWAWVGSEAVAHAHQLLTVGPPTLPPHEVYYLTAAAMALEPSAALIAHWRPTLLPYADRLHGHQSFLGTRKLTQAVGWQHQTSWRTLR